MKLLVNIFKLFVRHMRIDLGRCDIGVAEHHLDTTNISPV